MNEQKVMRIGELRKRNRRTIFTRGIKPYLVMILIVFTFSFLEISNSAATNEVEYLDEYLGLGTVDAVDVEAVQDYIAGMPVIKALPEGFVKSTVFHIVNDHSWILKFLGRNRGYAERNVGEMAGFLIAAFILIDIIFYLLMKVFIVGLNRYFMEARQQKNVKIRRILAPFSDKRFTKVLKTTLCYYGVMLLWLLTIVGGIIKLFQYYFVLYIVAENPDVTWKEARDLSKEMTKGYKWKIFLMNMSYIYLGLLNILPFFDLFVSTPTMNGIDAEMYFFLRNRDDIDRSLFIEDGFNEKAYVDRIADGEKAEDIQLQYKLRDVSIKGTSFDENDKYRIVEFIIMFFLFSFVGWLWEVGIHIYEDHAFVNRGTMYGPWLPIYGAGGAGIIVFLSRFKNNKPKLFVLTMVLCGILEYATSFYLEFFKNSKYWDYNDMFANINGRVCLAGLLAFAFGGFLGIYILGPQIKRWVEKIGDKKTKIICAVLVTAFLIDVICCAIFGPNQGAGVGEKYASLCMLFGC